MGRYFCLQLVPTSTLRALCSAPDAYHTTPTRLLSHSHPLKGAYTSSPALQEKVHGEQQFTLISRGLNQEMEPPESLSLFDHTHLELEGPGALPAGGSTHLRGKVFAVWEARMLNPFAFALRAVIVALQHLPSWAEPSVVVLG